MQEVVCFNLRRLIHVGFSLKGRSEKANKVVSEL